MWNPGNILESRRRCGPQNSDPWDLGSLSSLDVLNVQGYNAETLRLSVCYRCNAQDQI
jgi:hypothetical protein